VIRDSYVVKGGIGVKKIAQFYKVSLETFTAAIQKDFPQYNLDEILELYNTIQLPRRATQGSAGYDFYAPFSFALLPGRTIKIPTGIRAWMEDGWVLKLYPRSGLGFKYRLQMDNTVGIIDSDYYYSDNEGHIFIKMTNETREDKTVEIQQGIGFAQGIFLEYGITLDDCTDGIRNGGLGSTTR
jgi:dUTP pyrophosphatase